jgi:hypothetical protein
MGKHQATTHSAPLSPTTVAQSQKEKYRCYPCQTFIICGGCPYHDRSSRLSVSLCLFLSLSPSLSFPIYISRLISNFRYIYICLLSILHLQMHVSSRLQTHLQGEKIYLSLHTCEQININ